MSDYEVAGFVEIPHRGDKTSTENVCYLHVGEALGRTGHGYVRLTLDEETTKLALSRFGESVGVAIDGNARIAIYKGGARKLIRKTQSQRRRSIGLDSQREVLTSILGTEFRNYEYEARECADGKAILFTPKRVIG